MKELENLSRRDFLYVSAVAGGGAMLAACGGEGGTTPAPGGATAGPESPATGEPTAPALSPAEPTAPPLQEVGERATAAAVAEGTEYKQAPMLDEMADLPPVAERVPKKPYVVPHAWVKPGKYGGQMRMVASDPGGGAIATFPAEMQYGHSPLRWHRDGIAIYGGMCESWESNDDATQWTMNFREGLKWSDGEPCTTEDVMFWWEDQVLDEAHTDGAPTEFKSATGEPAKIRAVNDTTLEFTFDVPQPLFADYMACWVNGQIGPRWITPKHYLQQFHPKYNPDLKTKKDWQEQFDTERDYSRNAKVPVLNAWKLKTFREGRSSLWERNPYYYAVSQQGEQLPYIDSVLFSNVQNPEVMRLNITNGDVDYVHGAHSGLILSDVAGMRRAEGRAGTVTDFWDSGSGTGSIMFLNIDYEEEDYREVFRNPKFRQAISHAFNRDEVLRAIYFNQGIPTTGTLSPKAVEYRFNDEARQRWEEWRDSYIEYSPEKAMQMLDEVGLEKGSGEFRTFANGQPFRLLLQYGSSNPPNGEHVRKNQLLARDLRAVGIDARLAPVPSDSYSDKYANSTLQSNTAWEVGAGPNHLAYPEWVVPQTTDRWAPMHGRYWSEIRDTPGEKEDVNKDPWKRTPRWVAPEEGGPISQLYEIYQRARREPDTIKRHKLVWDIMKVHVEHGPFFMGSVANYPQLVVKKTTLMNVPTRDELKQHAQGGWTNPWIMPSPAVYDPEAYYWDDPENHQPA